MLNYGNRRQNDATELMALPEDLRERQREDRPQLDRRRGASRFSFEQTTRAEDGFEIVAPRGDLDFNSADDLRTVLLDLVERRNAVLVKLSAVLFGRQTKRQPRYRPILVPGWGHIS